MFDLDKYSPENIGRIKKVLKIILDEVELQTTRSIKTLIISPEQLKSENIYKEQFLSILREINGSGIRVFRILNDLPNSEQMGLGNNIVSQLTDAQSIYRLNEILASVKTQTYVTFPTGKDYIYSNGVLYLKTKTLSDPAFLDLSKAPILRPVFESFFYLYQETGKNLLDGEDILKKYQELTGEKIDWRTLIKRKSSIMGKMINPKPVLKKRIIWEYDKNKEKYRFEILPLSDG